jgi:hypothetical protein
MAELTKTINQAVKAMANQEGKYLIFSLAGEEGHLRTYRWKVRLSQPAGDKTP